MTPVGYFGDVLGQPSGIPLPWFADGAESNADMWCTPDETRVRVLGLYAAAAEQTERHVRELGLEFVGEVP
jgi:hypothetical protein